jgi:hypothetical protein
LKRWLVVFKIIDHHFLKVRIAKILPPMHLSIAIRSFFKNSAKNLNQYVVVYLGEEL